MSDDRFYYSPFFISYLIFHLTVCFFKTLLQRCKDVPFQSSRVPSQCSVLSRETIDLYSAFWTSHGREFGNIGFYNDNGWTMWDSVFPTLKYGFNGRHFYIYSYPVSEGFVHVSTCVNLNENISFKCFFSAVIEL